MYGKTLFLVEEHTSVGGIASGLVDLATLGAFEVEVEKYSSFSTVLHHVDDRTSPPSLVACGLSKAVDVARVGGESISAGPLVYLDVASRRTGPAIHQRGHILEHVVVPADFSVRSGCTTACLYNIARHGIRRVSLVHIPDPDCSSACARIPGGELGRVDMDWLDVLKQAMFKMGAEEVDFMTPEAGRTADQLRVLVPTASLVLVGSGCASRVASEYRQVVGPLIEHGNDAPAILITAADCVRRESGDRDLRSA